MKDSIQHSINNFDIINNAKSTNKLFNSVEPSPYKENLRNINNDDKYSELMSTCNEYLRYLSSRKNAMEEPFNLKNLSQENTKKAKLVLSKNISYRSPFIIKKIRMDIINHNNYSTINNNDNNNIIINNNNNKNNIYMNFNNSEFKNNILFPKKRRTDNKINIIINSNVEPKNKNYNTNIELGRCLIKNSINLNIDSKNQ